MIGGVLVAGLVVGAGVALLLSNDDNRAPRTTTTTTRETTTTTTTPPADDTSSAVWPFASSSMRYQDPVEAARGFAVDYVHFTNPMLGEFQQSDSRSGEVSVRPRADGPVTTVFVRQLGADGTWWVLGAATDNIQLSSPGALAAITSPVTLDGTSTAFEATVNVEVRQDGSATALGEGIVMGGANGQLGPFHGSVSFGTPTQRAGAIVMFTLSAEDGSIVEASVVRVTFT